MALSGDRLNRWRRALYTLYAPGYDLVARMFRDARRRSIDGLSLAAGERVLIVGAGTGLDFEFLPDGVSVLATDLTPAMLARARPRLRPGITLEIMDGQALALPDASFDAVVLHLIVAVIPDPAACLREAARVLRAGGRMAVFDKFVPDGASPSAARRLLNLLTRPLFSDVTLRFGDVLAASGAPLHVDWNRPAALAGTYRLLRLTKTA